MAFGQRSFLVDHLLRCVPEGVIPVQIDPMRCKAISRTVTYGSTSGPWGGIGGAAMSDFQITWILHGNTAIAFVDENPFGYTLTSTPDDRAMIVVGDADPGTMDLTRFERETEWIGNDGLTNVERDALADKYTRTAATMSSSDIDAAKARMEARADSLVSAHADLITGLIAMREAKQITRETVAERMGVHPRTVDVFERYDSNPKLSIIRLYANAVGSRLENKVIDDEAI